MASNSQPVYGQGYPSQASGYPPQGTYYAPVPQQPGYSQAGVYNPQTEADMGDPEAKIDGIGFTEKSIRMAFIRKVYGILMAQLVVTFGFVAVFVLSDDVKSWSRENFWLVYVAMAITLVLTIVMACCEGVRRKAPGNFICLGVFTIAEGFVLGTISSTYNADAVLLAVGITAVICLALTIFAFQTKIDFTGLGSILFIVLIVFMLFGLLTLFLPRSRFPILHIVYACIGALIFSFYLIYDTQLIIGGKHKYSISPEEYIFAALNLYLDIINIFLYILSIVGSRD